MTLYAKFYALNFIYEKKLVLSFSKKQKIKHLFFNDKDIETFMHSQDPVNDMIKHKDIRFEHHYFDSPFIGSVDLNQFLNEHRLSKSIAEMNRISYFKNLYFLKRYTFNSFEEFLETKIEKRFSNEYSELFSSDLRPMHCRVEKFTKKDMLSKIALHETNSIQMELNKKITEPSKGLFLISGKASTLKWLEILRNEESFQRIMDIHLTAKCK